MVTANSKSLFISPPGCCKSEPQYCFLYIYDYRTNIKPSVSYVLYTFIIEFRCTNFIWYLIEQYEFNSHDVFDKFFIDYCFLYYISNVTLKNTKNYMSLPNFYFSVSHLFYPIWCKQKINKKKKEICLCREEELECLHNWYKRLLF